MSCRYCRDSKLDPSCEHDLLEDPCDPPHPCPVCTQLPEPVPTPDFATIWKAHWVDWIRRSEEAG